jgi:hypothetical protein
MNVEPPPLRMTPTNAPCFPGGSGGVDWLFSGPRTLGVLRGNCHQISPPMTSIPASAAAAKMTRRLGRGARGRACGGEERSGGFASAAGEIGCRPFSGSGDGLVVGPTWDGDGSVGTTKVALRPLTSESWAVSWRADAESIVLSAIEVPAPRAGRSAGADRPRARIELPASSRARAASVMVE